MTATSLTSAESQRPFGAAIADAFAAADPQESEHAIPLMPLGKAADMGHAPDGTPLIDPRLFDSVEYARNPFPYLRIMRDHYPVFHDQLHNCYYLTRYDDIRDCVLDDDAFNTIPKGHVNFVLGNVQAELDGIEHRRRRSLYAQHLVGQALNKRIPAIERLAREMIDAWDGPGIEGAVEDSGGVRTLEFGRAFANEFPVRVVCQVAGIPDEARGNFLYWYTTMMAGIGVSEAVNQAYEARQHFEDYLEDIVRDRRVRPTFLLDDKGAEIGMDIISSLCRAKIDGDHLSTEEVTSILALLVAGGGDTTRGAILNMWYLLLRHPEQLAAVAADDGLWSATFHETLRCAIPAGGQQTRHANRDLEIHGVHIPAGSLVQVINDSANRDERRFKEPNQFNIFRDDLYTGKMLRSGYDKAGQCSHMTFGANTHFCPGAWISEQEATACSRILISQMKNPRINWEKIPKDIDGESLAPIGINAIRELWVDYDL